MRSMKSSMPMVVLRQDERDTGAALEATGEDRAHCSRRQSGRRGEGDGGCVFEAGDTDSSLRRQVGDRVKDQVNEAKTGSPQRSRPYRLRQASEVLPAPDFDRQETASMSRDNSMPLTGTPPVLLERESDPARTDRELRIYAPLPVKSTRQSTVSFENVVSEHSRTRCVIGSGYTRRRKSGFRAPVSLARRKPARNH